MGSLMPPARAGPSSCEGRKEETCSSVGPPSQDIYPPSSSDGIDYLRLLSFAVRELVRKPLIHLPSAFKLSQSGAKVDRGKW